MNHIFISYSHKDTLYAHNLAKELEIRGYEVWIDDRIDFGAQWAVEIQENLDTCAAFIFIMSSNSFQSTWVQDEVSRAKRKNKPMMPLLLEGEPWLAAEATQYIQVSDGKLPSEIFFSRIANVVQSRNLHDSEYLFDNNLFQAAQSWDSVRMTDRISEGACIALKQWILPSSRQNLRDYLDSIAVILGIHEPVLIETFIMEVSNILERFEGTRLFIALQNSRVVYRNIGISWNANGITFRDEIDLLFLSQNETWNIIKFAPGNLSYNMQYDHEESLERYFKDDSVQYHFQLGAYCDAVNKQTHGNSPNTYLYYAHFCHLIKIDRKVCESAKRSLLGETGKIHFRIDQLS
jgi:hypothetical protein